MLENDFEKYLRQKIDALKVQPADDVWKKIQLEVAEKKKRKKRFILFFMFLGLMVSGIFLLYQPEHPGASSLINVAVDKNENSKVNAGLPGNWQYAVPGNTVINMQPAQADGYTVHEQPMLQEVPNLDVTIPQKNSQSSLSIPAINQNITSISIRADNPQPKTRKKTRMVLRSKTDSPEQIEDPGIDLSATIPVKEIAGEPPLTEVSEAHSEPVTALQKEVVANPVAIEKPAVRVAKNNETKDSTATLNKKTPGSIKEKKWMLAIVLSGGIAAAGSNNYDSTKLLADVNNGAGNIPGGNGFYSPSPVNSGIYVQCGINMIRNFSPKSKLNVGLLYQLQTSTLQTGSSIPTTAEFASIRYNYGRSNSYTNFYHSITLPVTLSTVLFNTAGKNIWIDGGFTIAHLLQTNALVFNSVTGVYYKDKDQFTKTSVGLNASVFVNLAGRHQTPIYFGPALYYSLTPLSQYGIHAGRHNSFIGCRLQMNLNK